LKACEGGEEAGNSRPYMGCIFIFDIDTEIEV